MGGLMGRRPIGDRALTNAEKQARARQARASQTERWRAALKEIATIKTAADARKIAADALVS